MQVNLLGQEQAEIEERTADTGLLATILARAIVALLARKGSGKVDFLAELFQLTERWLDEE